MRSVKMLLGGGLLLLMGASGALNAWGRSDALKALAATGEKAGGFIVEKIPQVPSAKADYLHCMFVEGNADPAVLPFIVAAAAKRKGISLPSAILRSAEGTRFDPAGVDRDVAVTSVNIPASAEFFNSISPGAKVQVAVQRDPEGNLKNALFVGDLGRLQEAQTQPLNFLGLALLGLLLMSAGAMPAKAKTASGATPQKEA